MNISLCVKCGQAAGFPSLVTEPYTCLTCQEPEQPEAPATAEAKGGSHQRVVSSPMIVTQDLVNEIVRRAKASAVGLHQEPMTSLRITQYEEPCIESLAMMLVSAWEEKYDLVSVFSAAMSVIQEKAAND